MRFQHNTDARYATRLQDFGQHGREFVSSETGLRLLGLLADEAELRRFCRRQGIELEPLQRALQHTLIEARLRFCPVHGS